MRKCVLRFALGALAFYPLSASAQFLYLPLPGSLATDPGTVAVINTVTNALTATVKVGVYPVGSALNPAGTRLYVANEEDNTISVINTANNTVIATINAGQGPVNAIVNPAGTRLYVANSMTISVIDTSSNLIIGTIPFGSAPSAIAITPDGTQIYAGSASQGGIFAINTATNTVVARIGSSGTFGVAVTPDGRNVYTSNCPGLGSPTVSVINTATNTITSTVQVGNCPEGLAVNPAGTQVYVANWNDRTISVINTATNLVTAIIKTPAAQSVAFNPAGTRAYATGYFAQVQVIDTNTQAIIAALPYQFGPYQFAVGGPPAPSLPSTSVSLTTSPNPSSFGQLVTISATVTPASATGAMTFYDGGTVVGTAPVTGGIASLVVSTLASGSRSLTAAYGGDANNAPSTSGVSTQTVKYVQTITFGGLANVTLAVPPFSIFATASSGLAVTFVSTTPSICTVSGNIVTDLASGTCSITATQAGNGTFAPAAPVMQSFTVLGPAVTPGGIVPIDSTMTTIQPGEWASIYGTNLASSTATWTGNFPTSLGGTAVTIDGKAAYLSYVSPGLINFQAPNDTVTGTVPVVVTTGNGSANSTVTLGQFGPSFILLDTKHVAGFIIRSNGSGAYGGGTYDILGPTGSSLGYATAAARAGDIVGLFAVGLGPTTPVVPAGQTFTGAAATNNLVNLLISNVSVTPVFAGLSSAGLYQINLTVPVGLGTGDQALVAMVGGVQTQSGVVIPLQ